MNTLLYLWMLEPAETPETVLMDVVYPRRLLLGAQNLIVIDGGAPLIVLGGRN